MQLMIEILAILQVLDNKVLDIFKKINDENYTLNHCKRVAFYAELIARELKFSEKEIEILRQAALIHDLGKANIKREVLMKKGKFSDDDKKEIRKHVIESSHLSNKLFKDFRLNKVILQHHECFDGSGYPNGLKGEKIDPLASIISIADAFDSMTSDRVYRKQFTPQEATKEIISMKGKQFHPLAVEGFEKAAAKIEKMYVRH